MDTSSVSQKIYHKNTSNTKEL